jgi:hypothetical protein
VGCKEKRFPDSFKAVVRTLPCVSAYNVVGKFAMRYDYTRENLDLNAVNYLNYDERPTRSEGNDLRQRGKNVFCDVINILPEPLTRRSSAIVTRRPRGGVLIVSGVCSERHYV